MKQEQAFQIIKLAIEQGFAKGCFIKIEDVSIILQALQTLQSKNILTNDSLKDE